MRTTSSLERVFMGTGIKESVLERYSAFNKRWRVFSAHSTSLASLLETLRLSSISQ